MLNAIAAVDKNYGIGYNNELLEHIPEDLKQFKKITSGHTVIMGRKTYDSLPHKPLPNRLNIIISSQKINDLNDNVIFMTKEEADTWIIQHRNTQDIFIIGGSSIYNIYVPVCDKVFLTKIDKSHENVDSYFINLDLDPSWNRTPIGSKMKYKDIPYQFWLYERY